MADQGPEHLEPVVVAMERVLQAERRLETMLQSCRQQANAVVAAARERAAAIGRRTDARIGRLHTAYFAKVRSDIASLANPVEAESEVLEGFVDDAELSCAARRLAAKLTGDA
jgi:vacuolar-type H+-ATPase subunit H